MTVENGDIIYVDRAPTAYIYGEVQRPGALRVERGMTLLQALAQSGGLTPRGTERGIKVHRRDANGVVKIHDMRMNDLGRARRRDLRQRIAVLKATAMSLKQYLRILWARKWLVLALVRAGRRGRHRGHAAAAASSTRRRRR